MQRDCPPVGRQATVTVRVWLWRPSVPTRTGTASPGAPARARSTSMMEIVSRRSPPARFSRAVTERTCRSGRLEPKGPAHGECGRDFRRPRSTPRERLVESSPKRRPCPRAREKIGPAGRAAAQGEDSGLGRAADLRVGVRTDDRGGVGRRRERGSSAGVVPDAERHLDLSTAASVVAVDGLNAVRAVPVSQFPRAHEEQLGKDQGDRPPRSSRCL